MVFWAWIVVAIVIVLVAYELITWIKRRFGPPPQAPEEVEEPVAEARAELVRANMKIAVLESRLQEEQFAREDEKAALDEEHKQQLAHTEATYQRQMVTLSERLATNNKGDWRVAAEREKAEKKAADERYPVRMAAEIAAWRVSNLGETPAADPAAAEDMANTPQTGETADIEEIAAAVAAISGLATQEIVASYEDEYGPDVDVPGETWTEKPAELDKWRDDGDQEVLDQISILDEAPPDLDSDEAVTAVRYEVVRVVERDQAVQDTAVPDGEMAAMAEEASQSDPPVAQDLALLAGVAAGVAVTAFDEADAGEAVMDAGGDAEPALEEAADDGSVVELGADEVEHEAPVEDTAGEGEEIAYFENRWPDLEDQAMQRVLARRLGSEMDADYLDDDEFLREMGIQQNWPEAQMLSGAAMEDDMGAENWVTDPIEELALHLNGEPQEDAVQLADEEILSEETATPDADFTDHHWEEMVYAEAAVAREHDDAGGSIEEGAGKGEASGTEQNEVVPDAAAAAQAPVEELETDAEDEDALIAATVAEILSRAPEGSEPIADEAEHDPADQEPAAQKRNGNGRNGTNGYDALAADAVADEDPLAGVPLDEMVMDQGEGRRERPSSHWERQPVIWQAEYYDNTRLAEDPVVVRQDREIDFEWRDRAPVQGVEPRTFSVRWSGVMQLEPGSYRFTASAPDGMRLWLNDRLVISAWYDQSEQTYQRDFPWHGGPIEVRVEHYENGGNAKAFLTWDRVA